MPKKIFISYNHKDANIIDMIARRLELEFGRNNIFSDAWSIQPGDSIISKMNEGLEMFTTFFFFISPNSLESKMVSLEWQTALNRAVNNDLKFVGVRIAKCNPPVIISDKLYIDLFGEGMDCAVEKMKCVVKSESTYHPLEDTQNLIATSTIKNSKTISITIEAKMYAEANPTIAFACSNPLDDFSVCFNVSEAFTITGKDEITTADGLVLNARTVRLQRSLMPGFPFVFEVYLEKTSHLNDVVIYVLTDASKRMYKGIPIKEG